MATEALQWLAALAFIAVPLAALLLVWVVSRDHLVRCPETGGLGLVELEPAPEQGAQAPAHRIRRCDLWPQRQSCAQGCLARDAQTAERHGVDLKGLRPFHP